jgi:hypothetical protein
MILESSVFETRDTDIKSFQKFCSGRRTKFGCNILNDFWRMTA